MTGRADQWLLVLVLDSPEACRLVVGHQGTVVEEVLVGSSRRLESILDVKALADPELPTTAGWWLWNGRVEDISYAEDDVMQRWIGRWEEATLDDLYRAGLELPRPEEQDG